MKDILFHVLKCREVLFAGADLDDLRYVVDEDLAISDVTGIQSLLRCRDDLFYRNLGNDHLNLYLRKKSGIHNCTALEPF